MSPSTQKKLAAAARARWAAKKAQCEADIAGSEKHSVRYTELYEKRTDR